PAAAPAASSASASPASYKPTAVEVITPQREYTNPFASETPAPVPVVNEPAPQAAPLPVSPAPVAAQPAPARGSEMFPFTPMAGNEPKPGSPQPRVESTSEKAEIKILPPEEVK